jgi:tuberculosinol/isotuberculosinol synthase
MDFATFQKLTRAEVADEVRRAQATVCAFPINGTRRWLLLEHPQFTVSDYIELNARRHVEIYRLLFDHGIDTILAPIYEPVMHRRGEDYRQKVIAQGLAAVATHPVFTDFYEECQVRVRFYGDYSTIFPGTACAHLPDLYDRVMQETRAHQAHRLFYGVSTRRAVEDVVGRAIRQYAGRELLPDRAALIELYYGEPLPPVSLFITSGKFNVFGMPLLDSDDTSLYFTVAPSPFLTEQQLRAILYDHLYSRRSSARSDYADLTPDKVDRMRAFYELHRETTLGIGVVRAGTWYPVFPGVEFDETRLAG